MIYLFSYFADNVKTNSEKHQNLTDLLNRLKERTAENEPILSEHLDAISGQLNIESPNSDQSLGILRICRNLNETHREKALSIWMKLKNNQNITFTTTHLVYAMELFRNIRDVQNAEALWNMHKERMERSP